jgi:hypothetical protein
VFGVPVACAGEDEKLLVVLPAESVPEDAAVQRLIRDLFNIYGGVIRIRRVAALPRLANGKIDYGSLSADTAERVRLGP